MRLILGRQALEQIGHNHRTDMGMDHSSIQFGYIQQSVEHGIDSFNRIFDLFDQRCRFRVTNALR